MLHAIALVRLGSQNHFGIVRGGFGDVGAGHRIRPFRKFVLRNKSPVRPVSLAALVDLAVGADYDNVLGEGGSGGLGHVFLDAIFLLRLLLRLPLEVARLLLFDIDAAILIEILQDAANSVVLNVAGHRDVIRLHVVHEVVVDDVDAFLDINELVVVMRLPFHNFGALVTQINCLVAGGGSAARAGRHIQGVIVRPRQFLAVLFYHSYCWLKLKEY